MKVLRKQNILCIGYGTEIIPIWKSIKRAWLKDKIDLWPSHIDCPKANNYDVYGLILDDQGHPTMYFANASTLLKELFDFYD